MLEDVLTGNSKSEDMRILCEVHRLFVIYIQVMKTLIDYRKCKW